MLKSIAKVPGEISIGLSGDDGAQAKRNPVVTDDLKGRGRARTLGHARGAQPGSRQTQRLPIPMS